MVITNLDHWPIELRDHTHLHENMSRDRAADTFALGARRHIEVVEKQPLRLRFHDNEPDPFTVNLNMVGTRGGESRETAALRERG